MAKISVNRYGTPTTKTLFSETTHYDLLGDQKELRAWAFVITAVLFAIVFTAGILGLWNIGASYSCGQKAEILEVNQSYSMWTGCFYEIDGEWVPADSYRANTSLDS